MKNLFLLNPDITFLNFGSFGACPTEVFEDYQYWQMQLEKDPVQFIVTHGPAQLQKSREALGSYIGCDSEDVVFVPNPTYAINIVAKSLMLQPGEEVLTTDIEYGAMDKTWNYYSKKNNYVYRRQHIPLPITSKEDFLEAFWKGYNSKTRVIFIGAITSSTGLILPVEAICKKAKELGLLTIVDGAHVPGHLPLNLCELPIDIFTGACHKWMMTPKGCSFLYAKKEFQQWLDPLVISWGFDSTTPSLSQFLDYHQMQGTRDYSAFLTVPKALAFMQKNDWPSVSANCRKLVQSNVHKFADLLNTLPLAPVRDEFFGQLCSLQIKTLQPEQLKKTLYDNYKIEIPIMVHDTKVFIRYSLNAFNTQDDLNILYAALKELIDKRVIITD